FALPQIITAYHWIPLRGFNNEIIVRVEEKNYFFSYGYTPSTGFTGAEQVHYTGKLLALKNQVGADKIVQELAGHGIKIDKDTAMILSQGEIPSAYRPMVPVMPALAWLWLAALAGLVQILRGRRPRHLERSVVPT